MHNKDLDKFLEGELSRKQITDTPGDSVETDFIETYQQLINDSKTEIPDFDAFEKIQEQKGLRISFVKKVLPYAATVLLVISSVFVFEKLSSNKTELALNEKELNEIRENTTIALLHFSKEFNACLAKFEDAKDMQKPVTEMESLKELDINFKNPIKNFKLN